jgi:hypothetical protein
MNMKKNIKNKKLRIGILIVSVLLVSCSIFFIYKKISLVKAADREWNQTDWRGGISSQVIAEDVNTFSESTDIDFSNDGYISLSSQEGWQLTNWAFRRKILFDNTLDNLGVDPEDLTDFPVLIKLEDGVNIDYSKTNDDGSDIRFIDADDTELSYEIDIWDETGISFVWVKIPQIDVGNEDYIYMYYGNTSATASENPADVWSSNYKAVYHNTEITSGIVTDSLGNNNATKGTYTEPYETDSPRYKSQRYDGSNDYSRTDNNFIVNPSSLTIESWFRKVDEGHTYECALHKGSVNTIGSTDYWLGVDNVDNLTATIGANAGVGWSAGQTTIKAVWGEWYYLVASWDGSVVRVYINGQLVKQYNLTSYGDVVAPTRMGSSADGTNYQFNGDIDEMYISDASRSNAWIASTYKVGLHEFSEYNIEESKFSSTGNLISNIFDTGYSSDWGNITYSYSGSDTVTVKARTSTSDNMTGTLNWSECNSINSNTDISLNNCVNDEDRYIQYQIILEPNEGSTPQFEDITISFSASDQEPPTINASGFYFQGSRENDDWFNSPPIILWTAGVDDTDGNGIEGYCIALDEVNTNETSTVLDPANTSGILTELNDGVENDGCPYIVIGESLDLDSIDGLNLQADKSYYLSIKAIDYAGNVWTESGTGEFQDVIQFKYDDNPPKNVMYISTPSANFGNINEMFFTWPISGASQAHDDESALLGWQYAINSSASNQWKGSTHSDELDMDYIPLSGSEGVFHLDILNDEEDIVVGNNTIYFRAIDNAGNVSTYSTGGLSYSGQAPSFPAESVVTITPQTSQSNEYALSWPEAIAGEEREIASYYYMINTQPPTNINTLKNNSSVYIPLDTTTIEADTLVGAVKGSNSVYVVAIDDQDNYSPSNMISGSFELDSENPDPPQNFSISDTSVKGKELWRVALTWEEPEYKGNGTVSYIVEKSLDGQSWFELDTINGLAYSDVSNTSQNYYYRIGSVDTSDESKNNPSYTVAQDITPEGRYEEPPEMIDDVQVSNITSRGAQISWLTDRVCDSKVQIGIESNNYFDDEMYRSDAVVNHEIVLTNLQPGTTYYYRTKWTDEDGNTGSSKELTLVTNPAPRVEDVNISSVGLNFAILDITTKGAIKANILYGKTKNYGASKEINTSTVESEYSVMLTELEDGSTYHYTILLTDEEGYEYENFGDMVFDTPPRPQVSNVQIQEKKGVPTPTIEVFWESNIAVNSIVRYSHDGKSLDKVDMELLEGEHKMEIEGLDPDSSYQLTVEGVDAMGNRAVSEVYAFTTATDTRPPEVYGIKSEGDIQSSDIQTDRSRSAQLIISWETDEPSTSQVLYGEGAANDGYPYSTQTDSEMRYKHVIIVSNLSPSKVYHFKVVSKDSAGNVGESGSVTSITPKSTDTVMESVLGSLGRIFNFF